MSSFLWNVDKLDDIMPMVLMSSSIAFLLLFDCSFGGRGGGGFPQRVPNVNSLIHNF